MKYKRFFFVCVMGFEGNNLMRFLNFDIETVDKYPSLGFCKEVASSKDPNLKNIILISITELSDVDFVDFISEQ